MVVNCPFRLKGLYVCFAIAALNGWIEETNHIKYLTTVDNFQEKNDAFGLRDEESL